jgi:hypothetical protein
MTKRKSVIDLLESGERVGVAWRYFVSPAPFFLPVFTAHGAQAAMIGGTVSLLWIFAGLSEQVEVSTVLVYAGEEMRKRGGECYPNETSFS